MQIGKNLIGNDHPVYMIAELSANHQNSFSVAEQLVRQAAKAGANAVKVQTFRADTITLRSTKEPFQIKSSQQWGGQTLYDLYERAHMPWEWQPKLKELANQLGMDFFSSPFDPTSVDFLEEMDVPAYKIASFEIVDHPLIKKVASTGKPIIFSTGMATKAEIHEALQVARENGAHQIALLKCTSAYPALPSEMNLKTILDLSQEFKTAVGLSDHTLTSTAAVASVALGASIIEKHLTLARADGGLDSEFSLEPNEFKELVQEVRITSQLLGKVHYGGSDNENKNRMYRKSLFIAQSIKQGEVFTQENLRCVRPGHGLEPKYLEKVLGQVALDDIEEGTPLALNHFRKKS